jgi:hypothetical protein
MKVGSKGMENACGLAPATHLCEEPKYDTHVTPRIQRILKQWPNAKRVTALLHLLRSIPTVTFLNWKGEGRAKRFDSILHLLKSENVESEADRRPG